MYCCKALCLVHPATVLRGLRGEQRSPVYLSEPALVSNPTT